MTTLITSDLAAGTDYVVANRTLFGRFTDNRDQFPDQSARYDRLFAARHLVKDFLNGADSARVYAVPAGFLASQPPRFSSPSVRLRSSEQIRLLDTRTRGG
jgi:hypothetical protein